MARDLRVLERGGGVMCTYETETVVLRASGKTAQGWTTMNHATVYFDHPIHFSSWHALMIDVRHHDAPPEVRVALELDANSARELANTILRVLDKVPGDLLDDSPL